MQADIKKQKHHAELGQEMRGFTFLYDAQAVGANQYPCYQISHDWAHAQWTYQEDRYNADEEQD